MKKTTIKTDTDFKLEIKEDVYSDGEKVTYIHFHQKSGVMPMGSIFLRESGQMSFSADSHGKREDKPIFKESKTKLENCVVHSASLRTDIVKVRLDSFFSKENKK
jgi:hypothetical protein